MTRALLVGYLTAVALFVAAYGGPVAVEAEPLSEATVACLVAGGAYGDPTDGRDALYVDTDTLARCMG